MIIQHNISAINSHRQLGKTGGVAAKNLEKLSSGFKVNRAGDDAAGLAISEKMRGQIRGLSMAEQNTRNGVSLIQTAEGGCAEIHSILQRMRELAVQSANGTYQDEDRGQIELEYQAAMEEVDRIASSTHYNGIKLLAGGGKVYARDLPAGPGYGKGSDEAIAKELEKYGFACKVDNNGAVVGLPLLVFDMPANMNVTDMKANLIIKGSDTEPAVTLEINGNAYNGRWVIDASYTQSIWTDNPVNLGTQLCYVFEDSSGRYVGELCNWDENMVGVKLQAGKESGKITDIAIDVWGTFLIGSAAEMKDAYFGEGDGEIILQVGANGKADQRVRIQLEDMSSTGIGIEGSSVITRQKADDGINIIDKAVNVVSAQRAHFGAMQNRLEHTLNNLGVTKENLTAAESSIRDVDMAKEMMEFTKNSILIQASQSMLAQSNQLPQGVLQLLR